MLNDIDVMDSCIDRAAAVDRSSRQAVLATGRSSAYSAGRNLAAMHIVAYAGSTIQWDKPQHGMPKTPTPTTPLPLNLALSSNSNRQSALFIDEPGLLVCYVLLPCRPLSLEADLEVNTG